MTGPEKSGAKSIHLVEGPASFRQETTSCCCTFINTNLFYGEENTLFLFDTCLRHLCLSWCELGSLKYKIQSHCKGRSECVLKLADITDFQCCYFFSCALNPVVPGILAWSTWNYK